MKTVQKFIGLKGKTISRQDFEDLQKEARKGGYFRLDEKIMALLKNYPNQTSFTIKQVDPDSLQLKGESTLNGLEQLPFNFSDGFTTGLNKAVSSDDIYQYITDTLLELISTDKQLPWQKGWETGIPGLAATNFESKKAYRGINAVMLNMVYPEFPAYAYDIPYFLTFKQIEKLGGTLQKGAKGYRVIYYTILYKWADAEAKLEFGTYNKAKFIRWLQANKARLNILKSGNDIATVVRLATVPIMKYYNIFNADKIDGIDWKLEELKEEKPIVPIDTAEQIVEAWDDKPPIAHKGDAAFYRPSNDSITMPPKTQFNAMEQYYGTLFHEMIHSTGHPKRLNRDMGGGMQTKSYAFEELIAELGASFINGESGILFFNLNNSAAYLKGWRKRLETNMKGDNKFFFRASSRAQAAADLILDRSEEGIPKYLRDDKTKDKIIKEAIDNSRSSKKEKPSRKKDGKKALAKPNPKSKKPKEQQLSLVLNGKKKKGKGLNGPVDDLIQGADKLLDTTTKGLELIDKVKTLPGKVLSIADMLSMKFDKLAFKGKWADFMQNVPPNLRLMVYGQGKNGKTSFSFQFAEYLSQFGKVLYNLADQGISGTTQDLIRSTGLAQASNIVLSGGRSIDELREDIRESKPQFIFIDLMNNYEIDPRSFEAFMKQEFPNKSFILVMEATKNEDFRGEGTWLNIVDAKIFCKEFIAYNNGRLGYGEFVIWPERVAQLKKDRGEE